MTTADPTACARCNRTLRSDLSKLIGFGATCAQLAVDEQLLVVVRRDDTQHEQQHERAARAA